MSPEELERWAPTFMAAESLRDAERLARCAGHHNDAALLESAQHILCAFAMERGMEAGRLEREMEKVQRFGFRAMQAALAEGKWVALP